MRRVVTGLAGVSLVMWVANWISIDAGKGINAMCTVLGCMTTGAAIALFIVDQRARLRG